MKDAAPPVFELCKVELAGSSGITGALDRGIHLALMPGDGVCLTCTPRTCAAPLADILCGNQLPVSGWAAFLGCRWGSAGPFGHARHQSLLRRVFPTPCWLGHLSTAEEVLLFDRYHHSRPEAARQQEALSWCRHFGLPGLPTDRPGRLSPLDQQRATLVRALLGHPVGLVIELSRESQIEELAEPLATAIHGLRERGGAVIILSTAEDSTVPGVRCIDYRETIRPMSPYCE